jgi:uncharacterized protein YyaL (SSP411 family)
MAVTVLARMYTLTGDARYARSVEVALPLVGQAANRSAVPLLADRPQLDGKATAYVCQNFACTMPVTEPGKLAAQLGD